MARSRARKFALTGLWIIGGGILFAILPLLSTFIAGMIASGLDCRLDEAGTYPCPLFGIDIGGPLGFFSMLGWFAFFTFPIGALVVLLGLITLGVAGIYRWRG